MLPTAIVMIADTMSPSTVIRQANCQGFIILYREK